jgi:spore photoproduct lyase
MNAPQPQTFEIGSNSDLVLENGVTNNLPWTIEEFARRGKGQITFPTKFSAVESLLSLDHQGKVIFRMSLNPEDIIKRVEIGTSPLSERIKALNDMFLMTTALSVLLIFPSLLFKKPASRYGSGKLNSSME